MQVQKEHLAQAASKGDDFKAQATKIQSLEKTNGELEKKHSQALKDKSELQMKIAPLEKEKATLIAKVSTLESEKKNLNRRVEEVSAKAAKARWLSFEFGDSLHWSFWVAVFHPANDHIFQRPRCP